MEILNSDIKESSSVCVLTTNDDVDEIAENNINSRDNLTLQSQEENVMHDNETNNVRNILEKVVNGDNFKVQVQKEYIFHGDTCNNAGDNFNSTAESNDNINFEDDVIIKAQESKSTNVRGTLNNHSGIDSNSDDDDDIIVHKKRNQQQLNDSDDDNEPQKSQCTDEDIITSQDDENNTSCNVFKKRKRIALADSDSDSEKENVDITPHNKSFNDEAESLNSEAIVYNINKKGELVPEVNTIGLQKSRLAALCDSESSDEDNSREELKEISYNNETKSTKAKVYNKRNNGENQEPKRMTGKEALEQRKQIRSESQRMARESCVSLPYHKPKNYSLKDFLTRRPKFASAVPNIIAGKASVAIKMSKEQLALISAKIQEREKEVLEFYKSESESEGDENDADYQPPDANSADDTFQKEQKLEQEKEIDNEEKILFEEENISNEEEKMLDKEKQLLNVEESVEESEEKLINEEEKWLNEDGLVNDQRNTVLNENPNELLDEEKLLLEDSDRELDTQNKLLNHENEKVSDEKIIQNGKSEEEIINETKKVECTLNVNKGPTQTEEYAFNLEDLDDSAENNQMSSDVLKEIDSNQTPSENSSLKNNEDSTVTKISPEFIKEIEEYSNVDEKTPYKSKLEALKEKLRNFQPKLSGGPMDIIDLDEGVTKPNEVTKLMNRFIQHTSKKNHHKHKVELNIVSVSSGEILKETVSMNVEDEDDKTPLVDDKPGAKIQKLRDELQNQMALKRSELWQQKNTKDICKDVPKEGYEDGEEYYEDDDILDDEEEADLTETDEESEIEEIDTVESKKDRVKSAFVDDEAAESDEDRDGDDEETVENADTNSEDEIANMDTESLIELPVEKKALKRIVKGFTEEDSDEDDEMIMSMNKDNNAVEEDDLLPPHQIPNHRTPKRQISESKSELDFLTPVSYITGLQNLNSGSKFMKESPILSPLHQLRNEPSPLKESNWQPALQKKLFLEPDLETLDGVNKEKDDVIDQDLQSEDKENTNVTTDEDAELAALCTAPFPTKPVEDMTATQELLNMCTGSFSDSSKVTTTYQKPEQNDLKSSDPEQDTIISQLLDKEELERFKKKFDSPPISNSQQKKDDYDVEGVQECSGVIDSDEENDEGNVKVKRKKQKKLVFSDDEDSDIDHTPPEDEEIDLHDSDVEDDNVPVDNIGYDSEENEIEMEANNDEAAKSTKIKINDFFEEEAELSESEWGSADEDEKDLDTLEFELGDTDKFDESKIRNDIEKIHMRQLLDADTREVKLLQELLLEDGELHGTGRQRQFKWKNIDSQFGGDDTKGEDEDIFLDEEESEEQWRKQRHEREMFLKEQQQKSQHLEDDLDLPINSQLLKVGQKVLQRSISNNSQNNIDKEKSDLKSSPLIEGLEVKQPFSLLTKRGSFLSRSDQVLSRLAEITKTATNVTLGATAKNSRNFVFQSVSISGESTSVTLSSDKKRKAIDGTPNAIKKLRLSSNLSPANNKKKIKTDRIKKLFSN